MPATLPRQIAYLPLKPGVYLYYDATGALLYVGKAKRLRTRVQSYFRQNANLDPAKQVMVGRIARIDHIVVDSETEALLLESTLIRNHRPPYNVVLKDDKSWLYVKLSDGEFPEVETTRRPVPDGSRYFGPFLSARNVYTTLRVVRKFLPYRTRDKKLQTTQPAPECTPEQYQGVVRTITQILRGETDHVAARLVRAMKQASANQQFELAARSRDQFQAVSALRGNEERKVISPKRESFDVVSVAAERGLAAACVLLIRQGKLVDKRDLLLTHAAGQPEAELLEATLAQYYSRQSDPPPTVYVDQTVGVSNIIVQLPGSADPHERAVVRVKLAQRGVKRKLVQMAKQNAEDFLRTSGVALERRERTRQQALADLQKLLHLPNLPRRIECYDISNIQGTNSVGSMVVFQDGQPAKSEYRKFIIKTVQGANDFASLQEVIRRRLRRSIPTAVGAPLAAPQAPGAASSAPTPPPVPVGFKSWPIPDLMVIDGGKGQLSAVAQILNEMGNANLPLISLAKREEEIFLPGQSDPLRLPKDSPMLHLLQHLRDESHRFAISFYRHRHRKNMMTDD